LSAWVSGGRRRPWKISRDPGCDPDDSVFGELASMIRYPLKINWAGGGAHSLYDLVWAPRASGAGRTVSPETERALRALGYVE
jgi:hypothetical protein